jgi:cyanophycinase-like exopeptidase
VESGWGESRSTTALLMVGRDRLKIAKSFNTENTEVEKRSSQRRKRRGQQSGSSGGAGWQWHFDAGFVLSGH